MVGSRDESYAMGAILTIQKDLSRLLVFRILALPLTTRISSEAFRWPRDRQSHQCLGLMGIELVEHKHMPVRRMAWIECGMLDPLGNGVAGDDDAGIQILRWKIPTVRWL